MNDALPSFLLGLFTTCVLFLSCTFFVVGAKAIFLLFKNKFFSHSSSPDTPRKKPPKKSKPVPEPKPTKSIEIDPEQVEQIFVKKSS